MPQSTVRRSRHLPQPFPTKPAPFDRQGATEENLIDFTPELRAEALAIFENYVTGPVFTPLSVATENGTQGTIQLPGHKGGATFRELLLIQKLDIYTYRRSLRHLLQTFSLVIQTAPI